MYSCHQCGHQDAAEFLYCPRCGTKAVERVDSGDPLLGRILNGKYRVESEIGHGAMGRVYLCEHIGLKKKVALKVLHSDLQVSDESLGRFQREGIAAGKFSHPHLIQIFDFDRSALGDAEGKVFYLAMEYVEGSNLGQFLRRRGRLPLPLAFRLERQMLSCLAEAHRHGIVHRDLKPDNIMVTESARGEVRVKVLDFGLSKLVDRPLNASLVTQPGRLLGTPLYMAPEQAAGDEADERSDVYAAGLILWEMLAGERPFQERDSVQLFLTRPRAEAPSLRAKAPDLQVSDALEEFLHRALEREREKRFQTAEEMLNALDEIPFGDDSTSRSSGLGSSRARTVILPAPDAPEAARRVRWGLVAGGVLGGLVLLLGALMLTRPSAPRVTGPARVRLVAPERRSEQEQRYLGLLDDARVALGGKDSQAALTAVNQAFLMECRDAEAFLVRAEIYRARKDLDTAQADFRAATQGDPGYAEPLLGLGWIQFDEGALEEAAQSFARAAEIQPGDASVLAAQGALAWKSGDPETARELLERAVASDPSCAPAHLYLGRLALDRGEIDAAIAGMVEAKRNDPFATQPLVWLAQAYLAKGDQDQAQAQLEEALRLEPDSGELRVQLGSLLLERRGPAEVRDFLSESTEKAPRDGRLWILRALAEMEDGDGGDPGKAIDAFRRGFDLGARDPDARCLLGILYQRQGKAAEATAQFEAVLKEVGDYPPANLDLALVLFAQGDYLESAQRFERVLAFDDENAQAHLYLGLLNMNFLENDEKALAHLRRYRDLGGDDPRLADWIEELE